MKEYPRTQSGTQPEYLYEGYRSSIRRAPLQPLIQVPHKLSELTGPLYGHNLIGESDNDLTRRADPAEASESSSPDACSMKTARVRAQLWSSVAERNSSGRYRHGDSHAPLDRDFPGAGAQYRRRRAATAFVPSSLAPIHGAIIQRLEAGATFFSLLAQGLLSRLVT
jgi:protocatechuate 3,4-dioxygenase beta subunit